MAALMAATMDIPKGSQLDDCEVAWKDVRMDERQAVLKGF